MHRVDRQWVADVVIASAWAALISSFPSTIWELITDGDPLESTRAAGAMLIPYSSSDTALLISAAFVHCSITLFWAFILASILPRRHIIWSSMAAAAAIAFLDLKVIALFFFPDVYVLDFWPQFADHIAWGWALGMALDWRWREGKMAPTSEGAQP